MYVTCAEQRGTCAEWPARNANVKGITSLQISRIFGDYVCCLKLPSPLIIQAIKHKTTDT